MLRRNFRLPPRDQPFVAGAPVAHTTAAPKMTPRKKGLLDLPTKLRAQIYTHLLGQEAVDAIKLIQGDHFRTIGIPGASLLRTCRCIFTELVSTFIPLRDQATLDVRIVDSMAAPRPLRSIVDLNLQGVKKIMVKVMLSQLTDKKIITTGLSNLVHGILKSSAIRELIITLSLTRSYTDQAHFDQLVACLDCIRTDGNLELRLENPCGYSQMDEQCKSLGVNVHAFMKMRAEHLEYAFRAYHKRIRS